ncbi:MAG: hypothetical protein ABJI96_03510 [Paracoccaceae bacterium]
MTLASNFTMTRKEIRAVLMQAANDAADPYDSPAFQLRRLLCI